MTTFKNHQETEREREKESMSETPEETETISFSVKTATQSTLAMREIKKSALISEVKSELATRRNDGSTADLDQIDIQRTRAERRQDGERVLDRGRTRGTPGEIGAEENERRHGGRKWGSQPQGVASGSSSQVLNVQQQPRTWMDDANAGQRQPQAPDFTALLGGQQQGGGFDMFGGGGLGMGGMPNPTPEEIRAIENDPFVRQFMEQAMQDPELYDR